MKILRTAKEIHFSKQKFFAFSRSKWKPLEKVQAAHILVAGKWRKARPEREEREEDNHCEGIWNYNFSINRILNKESKKVVLTIAKWMGLVNIRPSWPRCTTSEISVKKVIHHDEERQISNFQISG